MRSIPDDRSTSEPLGPFLCQRKLGWQDVIAAAGGVMSTASSLIWCFMQLVRIKFPPLEADDIPPTKKVTDGTSMFQNISLAFFKPAPVIHAYEEEHTI